MEIRVFDLGTFYFGGREDVVELLKHAEAHSFSQRINQLNRRVPGLVCLQKVEEASDARIQPDTSFCNNQMSNTKKRQRGKFLQRTKV